MEVYKYVASELAHESDLQNSYYRLTQIGSDERVVGWPPNYVFNCLGLLIRVTSDGHCDLQFAMVQCSQCCLTLSVQCIYGSDLAENKYVVQSVSGLKDSAVFEIETDRPCWGLGSSLASVFYLASY